jgi:predicted HTH domain antitoxin
MSQIVVKIPDAVLYDTHMSTYEATDFARKAIALDYYTRLHISVGYCAQIAGMTEEDFIKYLGRNKISIFQFDSSEEFKDELANA